MFSIIIPLYNCEKYIEECVDSLLIQKYTDFEIIVVNDGSTDCSLNVIEKIKDSRIRIINQENKGLFHARLSGLKEAKGEICLFLDADDLMSSDSLESISRCFDEGYDCVIYKLATFYGQQKNNIIAEKAVFPDKSIFDNSKKKELLTLLLTSGRVNSIVCKAFRRELIDVEKLSVYPRIAIGEDALFTLELFRNMVRAIYLDSPFYYYRQQSESMSHNLTANIYYDNAYRFRLYRDVAEELYSGEQISVIKEKIDTVTFKMLTSMALNDRYIVRDYKMFRQIFQEVSGDTYFKEMYLRAYRKQSILYFCIVSWIYKGYYKKLYCARWLFHITNSVHKKIKIK